MIQAIMCPTSHWSVLAKLNWWWLVTWSTNRVLWGAPLLFPTWIERLTLFVVYSDNVNWQQLVAYGVVHCFYLLSLGGPMVDSTMILSLLSLRDADPNLMFTLSFNISFGPPSRIICYLNNQRFTDGAGRLPQPGVLGCEVNRSHYVNSSQPNVTRVTVTRTQRVGWSYRCDVTVEGRVCINGNGYNFLNNIIIILLKFPVFIIVHFLMLTEGSQWDCF